MGDDRRADRAPPRGRPPPRRSRGRGRGTGTSSPGGSRSPSYRLRYRARPAMSCRPTRPGPSGGRDGRPRRSRRWWRRRRSRRRTRRRHRERHSTVPLRLLVGDGADRGGTPVAEHRGSGQADGNCTDDQHPVGLGDSARSSAWVATASGSTRQACSSASPAGRATSASGCTMISSAMPPGKPMP